MEHRGACAADGVSGDGAGVMTDIPFGLFGYEPRSVAVACLFLTPDEARREVALRAFESTFGLLGLEVIGYRTVPVNEDVLGPVARAAAPYVVHAFIRRPEPCGTDHAFNAQLYQAKQMTRAALLDRGAWLDLFFTSLSANTIVYKAMCRSVDLEPFYPDLANPNFETRFGVFHRRFSTNTRSSWDKVQPFRVVAHNGEINTIAGNRSWAYSRERALGLARNQLVTHSEISDSGNLGEVVEALMFRSSMPHLDDILAITIPPAGMTSDYYAFWSRAMEPWDGPALVAYADAETVGARLDRSGFRPARWCMTDDLFGLASEAGVFGLPQDRIRRKGTLRAGTGATVRLASGKVHFRDPSESRENAGAAFEPRLVALSDVPDHVDPKVLASGVAEPQPRMLPVMALHGLTVEELDRVLVPMILEGKEPITSMGDTARPAIFSEQHRSLYDFLVQRFAQVTNPPLDYLREALVTNLETHVGARPNIFSPKELVPPAPALLLPTPVLGLRQMQLLRLLTHREPSPLRTLVKAIDCTFEPHAGGGLERALDRIEAEARAAIEDGFSVVLLTDRAVSVERVAVPSLLALRATVRVLNRFGLRLNASIVVEAGDIRTTHQVACAVGFGATAVCPHLALEVARFSNHPKLAGHYPQSNEDRLVRALSQGLLKIMSKMGISVVRSYQSSKMFGVLGLGRQLCARYLPGVASPLGGLELPQLEQRVLAAHRDASAGPLDQPLPSTFQLKEKNRGDIGERHSMTAARSKLVHDLVRGRLRGRSLGEIERTYEGQGVEAEPVSPRHLLVLRPAASAVALDDVEPAEEILARFGSGAMSFGAISARSQRDLFVAMRNLGGRCNSGEGGENPHYYLDGTTATTKQIASGRFGVTAEYLCAGDEIEIKVAQGAKPGEGGQLMGVKVNADIARARHASEGVDLISPPPLHDIYSIEDLKQLIYELKQLCPATAVCVKLVAGPAVGTVAVGVVKAGADVIQISGSDGGTGAAPISSMKHAGFPWELGLCDAHETLTERGLRDQVRLRVDGGLSTGQDVVMAAALGADEFGFGKALLVAQGCIMARICEKNRCPTGIATHDPKFLAKYKGSPEHVETFLRRLAARVREHLAVLGVRSLAAVVGQRRHLQANPSFRPMVRARGIDLSRLLAPVRVSFRIPAPAADLSAVNARILSDCEPVFRGEGPVQRRYRLRNEDRAVGAALAGAIGRRAHELRMQELDGKTPNYRSYAPAPGSATLTFEGSAGQGFAAFTTEGMDLTLWGEANDSVAKSMSGGRVVVRPAADAAVVPESSAIVGNGCLYGATGGELLVHGEAGDRFAVRNSGAVAVVEGVGLHACEYMTGGVVVILRSLCANAGAGMTGGRLWCPRAGLAQVNDTLVSAVDPSSGDLEQLEALLRTYLAATGSATAGGLLADQALQRHFALVVPRTRDSGPPSVSGR